MGLGMTVSDTYAEAPTEPDDAQCAVSGSIGGFTFDGTPRLLEYHCCKMHSAEASQCRSNERINAEGDFFEFPVVARWRAKGWRQGHAHYVFLGCHQSCSGSESISPMAEMAPDSSSNGSLFSTFHKTQRPSA